MPDPVAPTSQKGQLDALFAALKVTDFNAAVAAIGNYTTAGDAASGWKAERAAFMNVLGVDPNADQATALTAITTLKTAKPKGEGDDDKKDDEEKAALFASLGAKDQTEALAAISQLKVTATNHTGLLAILGATDQNAAIVAIGTMKQADGNHAALVKALGATDHASALVAATDVEVAVAKGVKQRAASAGLGEPAPKGGAPEAAGDPQRPVTARSRLAASINTQVGR